MVQAFTPQVIPAVAPEKAGAIYMVSVAIRVGYGTISLKSDSLKSDEIAQALKENGVKSRDTLPVFEFIRPDGKRFSLTQAGTALSSMLDRLQNKFMLCSASKRWWFVAEADWASLDEGLQDMEAERRALLSELQDKYDEAHDLFRLRLMNILTTAQRMDEYDEYVNKFPSWGEIEDSFRIEIDGPIAVPSAVDLAKKSPEMQRWMGNVHQQLRRDFPKLTDDICAAAADALSRLETAEPGSLSEHQKGLLDKAVERLGSLRNLHDSMSEAIGDDSSARRLIDQTLQVVRFSLWPSTTEEVLGQKLSSLRSELIDSELLINGGKGAKALYQWVHGQSLEDRVKAIAEEIRLLQEQLPELPPEDKEARLLALKAKADQHAGLLTHAAGALKTMLQSLDAPAQPTTEVPAVAAIAPSEPESIKFLAPAATECDEVEEAGF